jgi:hypothetical protein
MRKERLRLTVSILGLAMMLQLSGQKFVNSPYSRFNLGMLESTASFRSAAMGGLSAALRDNSSISYGNAASYSSLDTNSFVFDVGADYAAAILKNANSSHFSDDYNFDHIIVAFPVRKNWGLAAGIIPFSNGYYSIAQTLAPGIAGYDEVAGSVTIQNRGTGGITKAFIGTGVQLFNNFSAGMNMNVLFGEINRVNAYYYISDPTLFNTRLEENLTLSGINFDWGVQYTVRLDKNRFFNFGLSHAFGGNMSSDYSSISIREHALYAHPSFSPDTVSSVNITDGRIVLPQTLTAAVTFGIDHKLNAGIEYSKTSWDKASVYGANGYLAGIQSLRAGVEFIPDRFSFNQFHKRMEYRLGAHMSDNYLVVNGEQIKEFGITFGVGLPMKRSWSKLNMFFDYTSRGGSLSNGLHRENILSVGISLNLYDYWFLKAKYD